MDTKWLRNSFIYLLILVAVFVIGSVYSIVTWFKRGRRAAARTHRSTKSVA